MEAAGIEPASRDRSMKASTCVVGCLIFAVPCPCRPGHDQTSQERFLTQYVLGMALSDSELATDFWTSPTNILSQGNLFLGSHR